MRKDCGADCGARFGGRGEIDNNEVRASGVTTTYSYAASGFTPTQFNQLARYTDGTKTVSFTYDRSGNRLTRTAGGQTDTYAYDAENRLVTLTKSTTDTGTPGTYRYAYDYRTRRVERAETIAGTTSTTAIVFSGGTSVQEYTGAVSTTSLAVQYVRGSDWGGGVGGLLYSVRGGTPSFKHYDARGDVIAESNATGASTWRAQYDAYGTRGQESGTPSADRQRGNTKDEDPSGLRNDGFRYYDLDAQIYLTADPAGFVDGPNLYCYVVQNPWSRFDPDGQFWSALCTAAFAAYDTYQYATGKMSGAEYARSMVVNGAALAADIASAGMGGGMAVRAAATAQKINRVVQRADKVISAGESLVSAAQSAADGDMRGALLSGASGVMGIVPGSKSANKTKGQTSALVDKETKAAKAAPKSGVYEIRGVDKEGKAVTYVGSSKDMEARLADKNHPHAELIKRDGTTITKRPVGISDAASNREAGQILRTNEEISLRAAQKAEEKGGAEVLNEIQARAASKFDKDLEKFGDRRQ
jgi:RHS repeat-associated protein